MKRLPNFVVSFMGLTAASVIAVLLDLIVTPGLARAQMVTDTTGAITGKVVDATGGPVSGATVAIASPALMGQLQTPTNAKGTYRFPAIPPGTYGVRYEHPKFSTVVRSGIKVGLGFTATVNVRMEAKVEQVVTVAGQSPVLDLQSTRTATTFQKEQMADMPSARDLWSGILAQTAAVQVTRIDVGGSAAGTQTGYAAYDYKGGQNRPMLDGMVVTEGTSGALFYYDYGSFAEVSAGTAAHAAEAGWPGVVTMFLGKTGANAFHGNVYADYQNRNVQSRNIDEKQIALGFQGGGGLRPTDINRMHSYYDARADIGGYLKKDKLWWYFSVRDQDIKARYPNFPVKPHETKLQNLVGKVTYALSPTNKLIAYAHAGLKQQPNRLDTHLLNARVAIHETAESTWNQRYWGWAYKGEWNSILSDWGFFEVRSGIIGYNWPNYSYTSAPSFADLGSSKVWGSNREWQSNIRRAQSLGSLTVFAGTHSLKFGGEVFRETGTRLRGMGGKDFLSAGATANVLHVLRNGTPIEVYLFGSPSVSENGLWTISGYAADVWRLSDKLTLSPGLRLDRYESFLPEQEHPAGRFTPVATKFPAQHVLTWNLWAPRFGATYDLRGNGRTVLKFNYATYWWNPGVTLAESVNPNPPDWYGRYTWTDGNGNGVWDPAEQGRLLETRGAGAGELLDPNLKDAYTREVAAWFERELMADFGVRTGIVWRGVRQKYQRNNRNQPWDRFNVPVLVRDPGPDGRVGTSDDGATFPGFNVDPALLGLPSLNVTENIGAKDDYYTWEITANKRMSNRWMLNAAFSYRLNQDNGESYFDNRVRDDENPRHPNQLINTENGRNVFTTWSGKVNATIETPWWGLRVTPTVRHQSGSPFGRTFLAQFNFGSARLLAEPMDARRQDNITLFDVRLEKGFRLGLKRLGVFLDVYNMTNTNPGQNIIWSSGASFLRPTQIVPPRIARVGAKFDW